MNNFESPIQNLDAVDVIGKRKDGGVDLVVSCSGPLDESSDTLIRLSYKVRAYLSAVNTQGFRARYGAQSEVKIFVSCAHAVSDAAASLIMELEKEALSQHVQLSLVENIA